MQTLISNKIDQFFKSLGHTPGPWKFEDEYVRAEVLNENDYGNQVADVIMRPENIYQDELRFNGALIAQAPQLLRTIAHTYLTLLVYFAYGEGSEDINLLRIRIDFVLADLRNKISLATSRECQELQTIFEDLAYNITTIDKVARKFAELMKAEIGIGKLKLVNEQDEDNTSNTCATHDFCDANMVMHEAMLHVTNIDASDEGTTDETRELWNEAWDHAKRNRFFLKIH